LKEALTKGIGHASLKMLFEL